MVDRSLTTIESHEPPEAVEFVEWSAFNFQSFSIYLLAVLFEKI